MDDIRGSNMNLDIVKLFVGQIPKDMDEDSLRVYFEEFGPLAELSVIRDSSNLASKGCAFVTYRHAESAQCAVEKLHDKVKLPNSLNALQVRVAETQTERENKLFIGMLPKTVNEQDLHAMFVVYGELREVHIIRGPEGSPKGCAFVKYVDREAAIAAIEDLNETIPMGATRPLVVKFADSKKQGGGGKFKSHGMDYGVMDGGIMGGGGYQQMGGGMRHGGGDYWGGGASHFQQKMMNPYPQMHHHQQQHQQMMGAPFMAYNSSGPAVPPVSQQRYPFAQGAGAAGSGYVPSGPYPPTGAHQQPLEFRDSDRLQNTNTSSGGYAVVPPGGNAFDGDDSSDTQPGLAGTEHELHSRPPEGPSGANLFIYHLPRDLTDADLATLFAPFGNVISAKVFVDKKTSDSKGFGFVSYDVLDSANAAIESMNGFQIGSKRLKVQHKRVMSGSGADADEAWGGSSVGGGGEGFHFGASGGPPQRAIAGVSQYGLPRRPGAGGVDSLVGGMGNMNLQQQQFERGADLYGVIPSAGAYRGSGGYGGYGDVYQDYPPTGGARQQQQPADYPMQQPQQRYQQY